MAHRFVRLFALFVTLGLASAGAGPANERSA